MDSYPPPASITLSPQSPNPTPSNSNVNPSSSIFRPRRSDDWHEYREIIEQLYRNDQLKLRDVKRIMERDYKFQASYVMCSILLLNSFIFIFTIFPSNSYHYLSLSYHSRSSSSSYSLFSSSRPPAGHSHLQISN